MERKNSKKKYLHIFPTSSNQPSKPHNIFMTSLFCDITIRDVIVDNGPEGPVWPRQNGTWWTQGTFRCVKVGRPLDV